MLSGTKVDSVTGESHNYEMQIALSVVTSFVTFSTSAQQAWAATVNPLADSLWWQEVVERR
jgi:hypothetical protein